MYIIFKYLLEASISVMVYFPNNFSDETRREREILAKPHGDQTFQIFNSVR